MKVPPIILAALLFPALCLAGCLPAPEEIPVSSITITNIPLKITGTDGIERDAYKIYVNASNSMDDKDPHVTQGTAIINGQTSVTIDLFKPYHTPNLDPDLHGLPWSGEALYFSIIISPQNAPSQGAIYPKGSAMPLNDSRRELSWGDAVLQDFVYLLLHNQSGAKALDLETKLQRMYDDIICKDDAIDVIAHP
jgi:hypothetical protein